MENEKETTGARQRNALTIGIRSRETADRFLEENRRREESYERTLVHLLDRAATSENDSANEGLLSRIEELEAENNDFQTAIESKDLEIADLQAKLESAVKEANENAESGLGKQLKLEELQQLTDGAIIIKPNPVVAYFLNEMAAKTGSTPARILEELYLADLQNPTVNNLPYTVSSGEIRQVIRKLKEEAGK